MAHLDSDISNAIKVARVLCILFVVYPHIPPYSTFYDPSQGSWQAVIWFINGTLGRNSVPLLSLVSGYLCYWTTRNKPYVSVLAGKFKVLIIPMVLWNLIATTKRWFFAEEVGNDWLNLMLALSESPAITPLYFLRDVFVCFLFLPLLLRANRFSLMIVLIALAINSVYRFNEIFFISKYIPLFFVSGYVIAKESLNLKFSNQSLTNYALFFFAILALGVVGVEFMSLPEWLKRSLLVVNRLTGASFMWCVSLKLARMPILVLIKKIEPSIFLMFCSHTLFIGLFWKALLFAGLEYWTGAHVVVFTMLPFIVLTAVYLSDHLILKRLPAIRQRLVGNRGSKVRRKNVATTNDVTRCN
ncbi:acyltransferase [Vibrio sp. FNV 38]|nr:acyltransferase [Vibrio sp. FNV 38]